MKILRLVLSLTVISAVCAGVLALVDHATREQIARIAETAKENAARAVMPEGVASVERISDEAFVGKDAAAGVVGYAYVGSDPKGYGGPVKLMVGFRPDRTVVAYRKLEANETPGLGAKLTTSEFSGQFTGKSAERPLSVRKDGGEIEAITAATITSRAVCGAINDAASKMKGSE